MAFIQKFRKTGNFMISRWKLRKSLKSEQEKSCMFTDLETIEIILQNIVSQIPLKYEALSTQSIYFVQQKYIEQEKVFSTIASYISRCLWTFLALALAAFEQIISFVD